MYFKYQLGADNKRMVLNYIWIAFFLIAFAFGIVGLIMGDTTLFQKMVDATSDSAKTAFQVSLGLTGVLSLWLGIMKIGEKAGMVNMLARMLSPVFTKLFPDIPKNHPVMGSIFMNIASNMLGLDNAATPTGLKAMAQMQELNTKKDTATNPMIMFLVLNTSGLTIIPTSILAVRSACKAVQPTDVFVPILLATTIATLVGIIITSLWQRINIFQPVLFITIFGLLGTVGFIIWGLMQMPQNTMNTVTSVVSNLILMSIIVSFIGAGLFKKINVYDAFIEGAKEGFATAVRIIPYLVAILVAVGVFRASGAMDICVDGIRWTLQQFNIDTTFVDALPTAMMKPLSGSGARGLMLETMHHYGADSFRRQAKLHISRVYRHHILYIGCLFRQHWCTIHTPCSGLRTTGRPRWCACRNRNMLHFLLNEHKTKWQI